MQLTPLRPRRRRNSAQTTDATSTVPTDRSTDLSSIAHRIAGLIDGPVTEALVVILTELYGDALSRIVKAIETAPAGGEILDRLCDDRLVGGLLVVHDLHPRPLVARVERALAAIEFGSIHALPVALDRIEDDVVYLRLAAATGPAARNLIARAVASAAPEISCVLAEFDACEERTLHA